MLWLLHHLNPQGRLTPYPAHKSPVNPVLINSGAIHMTNAPTKPEFEGQIVKFISPHANVWLYDICKRNIKYGWLEWWALNDPTPEQCRNAMLIEG
jgi:hypothetical protein